MENISSSTSEIQPDDLTWREQEVLSLLAGHLTNKEIGADLHLAETTIKWYNQQIFSKLGVANRKQAAKKAGDLNLLEAQEKLPSDEKVRPLNNLPSQLNSFIGRMKEVAEVKKLLESSRLVTLTGAGGSGKTRLALQVAKDLVNSYKDGVWLVELAAISDPSLVSNEIAAVLKLNARGDTSHIKLLTRFLERKHLLLLLDNFEHLDAAAPMVGELLAAAPKLTVLVTSRAKLNIYGEQEYSLSPLNLPDLDQGESAEHLLEYEAIDLFVQRARAAQPGLALDKAQIDDIARICVRLDGLPLAIELAAPLAKIYGFAPLAQRLEKDLEALPQGPRDMPARQRTLHATMDWSYQLLDEDDKTLFDRLSVFSGGGTLETIESVCAAGLSGKIIDQLASLVDKNLLIPIEAPDGELHFMMLETIKDYSHGLLTSQPGASEIYRNHAAYFADLAEQSSREIRGERNMYWLKRLSVENKNLNSALAWSFEGDEPEFGLRMVGALSYHWYYNAVSAENSHWINLALEKSIGAAPALRAAVLQTAGNIAYQLNDLGRSQDFLQNALELYQELGDEFKEAAALSDLSISSIGSSQDLSDALSMARRGLEIFRKFEDKGHMADSYNILGELTRAQGDYKAAKKHYQRTLALSKETGERLREAMQYINLSFIAFHEGDYETAEQTNKKGLSIFVDMDSNYGIALHLASLAGPIAALGNPKRAARILGAAIAQLEVLSSNPQPADQAEIDLFISNIQKELGAKAFQEAWLEGQRMTIQESVAYAFSDKEAKD